MRWPVLPPCLLGPILGRHGFCRCRGVGRAESTGCVNSGRRWHRRIPSRGALAIPRGPFLFRCDPQQAVLTVPRASGRPRHPLKSAPGSDYTDQMEALNLPLDYAAIGRILPHRYPFLLVDRITEFEADKRIVGVKNVSLNEPYLAHRPGERPVLPPTILTEAVNQVGAILILSKPENREKLIFIVGIERVRYRRPAHPGDVLQIEVRVKRLRSRMGQLQGVAHSQRQSGARRPDDVCARSPEIEGCTQPGTLSGLTSFTLVAPRLWSTTLRAAPTHIPGCVRGSSRDRGPHRPARAAPLRSLPSAGPSQARR